MANENSAARYLGTTDDVTACDCCGRVDLKSTVALVLDGERLVHFGVTCAAKALAVPAATVRKGAREADRQAAAAARHEAARISAIADAAWQAFLNDACPEFARSFMGGPDRFRQIAALGGYTAARAAYEAA